MANDLFIGIDAGGSQVRALLGTASGEVLATSQVSAGANPNLVGLAPAADTLAEAVRALLARQGGEGGTVRGIYAAVAGALTGDNAPRLEAALSARLSLPVKVGSDAVAVFESAPELPESAICVLLGTGFAAFARTARDAALLRVRGWGARFDAAASGYALGRAVLREALREDELRALGNQAAPSPLLAAVRTRLGLALTPALPLSTALPRLLDMPVRDIAAFAPLVLDESVCPEPLRSRLLSALADEVAEAVRDLARFAPRPVRSVLLSGGIATAAFARLQPLLVERLPGFDFRLPTRTPAEGALLRACRIFQPSSATVPHA